MVSTKQSTSKFRRWQQNSKLHIAQPSDERHHCHCCDFDYTGNFCPQCGQKAGDKHITWTSIRTGVMDLWGMGTRSLPYTLWQLLLRPGYLIGDYISGRRQESFPPIKMLVFVALFVFLVTSYISPDSSSEETDSVFIMMDYAFNFFDTHYDVAVMFFFSFLIIPTYFVFRFAPRCDHHTLPEGFFIQVFNSTLALLLILIVTLLGVWNFDFSSIVLALIGVFVVYRSYYQLFGYSHWSTLWRVIAVIISGVLTLGIIVVMDHVVFVLTKSRYDQAMRNILCFCVPYILGLVIIIGASYFISRRTAKQIKPIDN